MVSEIGSTKVEEAIERLERDVAQLKGAVGRLDQLLRGFANDFLTLTPGYNEPGSLLPNQMQFYSQNGEDGIIAEMVRRTSPGDRVFLEIGCGDGRENCTRLLLESGWTGFWLDGSLEAEERIAHYFKDALETGRLKMVRALITKENLPSILDEMGVPDVVDFLSLDVDQNTSHLWRAFAPRKARLACIEYNASVPPSVAWEVPYRPNGGWDGSNVFGAGLKSLEHIGEQQGMKLVGCDSHGVNAFFVAANEVGDRFAAPFTAEHHYQPPRFELAIHRGHKVRKQELVGAILDPSSEG